MSGQKKDICVIYVVSNTINEKVYVGQTWGPLYKRWYRHKNNSGSLKLSNAIAKYGAVNFTIKPIFCVLTQTNADYFEQLFIERYDSINSGYNIKTGGSHGKHSEDTKKKLSETQKARKFTLTQQHKESISAANRNKIVSEETKRKISEANKGKVISEDTKQKLREALSGPKSPVYGSHHTDEVKEYLSKINTGENHPMWGKHHSDVSKAKMSLTIRGENNPIAKLTDSDVVCIKQMLTDGQKSAKIARIYNVGRNTIGAIKRNVNWKHIPWPQPSNNSD